MNCIAVDLFCGIGGLTKGLELSGIKVAAGIDIDEKCKFAYTNNNSAIFINKDIESISANEILQFYTNECTKILVGCAPCQPFSKYSKRYRKDGHTDDKWKILYSFSDLIKDIMPDIVSMENVPQLVKEVVFIDFVDSLEKLGYHVCWEIVFCPDYGVPQKRRRLVLLASLLGSIKLIEPMYNRKNHLTVYQAIGKLPKIKHGERNNHDSTHRSNKLTKINYERIKQSKQGGTWRDWSESLQLKCHKKESGKTYPSVYGRMSWHKPSPTITTQFYGYGNGRFGHPEQNRALSLREGAILQSFPPDYAFEDSQNKFTIQTLGTHIGNAVPVQLGVAIGKSILEHIKHMECD